MHIRLQRQWNHTLKKLLAAVLSLLFVCRCPADGSNVIVVTATRLDALSVDVMHVPSDVTVIDSETIERAHAQNLPELLQSQGNVTMRSVNGKGNTGELSMRGFGENSGLRVLLIIDDQKINRSDMGIQDWQQIPLDEIERIEILRGGQSVLYGNHALSGVIRITTKKGDQPITKVSASAGSHQFNEYSLTRSGREGDSRYTAGANYQSGDGYRYNSSFWSKNFNANMNHALSAEDTFNLRLSSGENEYQLPGPLTYEQYRRKPRRSLHKKDDQYAHTENDRITALYEGKREWGNIQLNGGFNSRDIDWAMSGLTGINEQRGYSVSPKVIYGDNEAFSLSGGLDLLYDTLDFTGNDNVTVNNAELDRLTVGPFLMAKKRFFECLTFSAGVRYEWARTTAKNLQYNKEDMQEFLENPWGGDPISNPNYPAKPIKEGSFDDAFNKSGWSYEASTLWQISEALSLWFRYNKVYRYPALDETTSYQGYPLANPLNKGLDPETGDNFELGTKLSYGAWRASASLFYLLMDGEIAYDDQKRLNVNIGSTERLGTDLLLAYEEEFYGASCLATLVSATHDGGRYDGNDIPLVPEAHSTLALWLKPLSALRLTATYTWISNQYQGGDYANRLRMIESYGLVGLRADLRLWEHLTLFAKVDNLLDEQYASSAYSGAWYPGTGRAIYGGVTLEF